MKALVKRFLKDEQGLELSEYAVMGFEYYFVPEFSIYLKAAGRFFTNPTDFGGFEDPNPEMGVNMFIGAFYAL